MLICYGRKHYPVGCRETWSLTSLKHYMAINWRELTSCWRENQIPDVVFVDINTHIQTHVYIIGIINYCSPYEVFWKLAFDGLTNVNVHLVLGWTEALESSVCHQKRLVCKMSTSDCSVNTVVLCKSTFCTEILSVKSSKVKKNPLRALSCSALNLALRSLAAFRNGL